MRHRIAAGVIFEEDGRILLVRHTMPGACDLWVCPGGAVEGTEDRLAAARSRFTRHGPYRERTVTCGYTHMNLVRPTAEFLPSYVAALQAGWSPDLLRGAAAAQDDLRNIAADSASFLAAQDDTDAKGGPVTLPDGSQVPRLPSFHRWLWDGEFCGVIGLRWQPGTPALPPHCLGHIGYAVVPWKRRRGYATSALRQILPEAKARGLQYVELTTDLTNLASKRIIEANGGVLVERFNKPAAFGGAPSLRYRIMLA